MADAPKEKKPYVMTPARLAALEKCRAALLAKRAQREAEKEPEPPAEARGSFASGAEPCGAEAPPAPPPKTKRAPAGGSGSKPRAARPKAPPQQNVQPPDDYSLHQPGPADQSDSEPEAQEEPEEERKPRARRPKPVPDVVSSSSESSESDDECNEKDVRRMRRYYKARYKSRYASRALRDGVPAAPPPPSPYGLEDPRKLVHATAAEILRHKVTRQMRELAVNAVFPE